MHLDLCYDYLKDFITINAGPIFLKQGDKQPYKHKQELTIIKPLHKSV